MTKLLSCRYNMDTNRVEAQFEDGTTLAIDCIAVEDEYGIHSTKRFQLGQKIKLSYRDFHETTAKSYDSIITAIEWTFRGGTKLSCGGEDSRVMADCIRSSKGDKVRKEARNRCRALEKRVQKLGG